MRFRIKREQIFFWEWTPWVCTSTSRTTGWPPNAPSRGMRSATSPTATRRWEKSSVVFDDKHWWDSTWIVIKRVRSRLIYIYCEYRAISCIGNNLYHSLLILRGIILFVMLLFNKFQLSTLMIESKSEWKKLVVNQLSHLENIMTIKYPQYLISKILPSLTWRMSLVSSMYSLPSNLWTRRQMCSSSTLHG